MTEPVVAILLTTYRRTDCAIATIKALKENLQYPQIWWYVTDDHSPNGHVSALVNEIGSSYRIHTFDSDRQGVGFGMNHALRSIFADGTDQVLVMEDDWVLNRPVPLAPFVNLLDKNPAYGMIRFGYLTANLLGYVISEQGKLFWRLENNQETYRFTGHPSLRHKRFHEIYGWYDEHQPPGMTELSMCGKTNAKEGPAILYPAECGQWGFFGHIGSESLADVHPI